jgi:hypothetical protein
LTPLRFVNRGASWSDFFLAFRSREAQIRELEILRKANMARSRRSKASNQGLLRHYRQSEMRKLWREPWDKRPTFLEKMVTKQEEESDGAKENLHDSHENG